MRAWERGGPVIVNKARQIGISTVAMIRAAHLLCERPGATKLAISKREKDAKHLLGMCKLAYETAERPNKPKVTLDNQLEFEVAGGGRVVIETANPNAGRGWTGLELFFDEFAFLPWQEDMWRAAQPSISASGNAHLVSTPNGQGDIFESLFHRHADDARLSADGEITAAPGGWRVFRLPWWVYPGRDETWKDQQLQSMTRRDFAQEYECDFLASGEAVFRAEDITAACDLWRSTAERVPSRVAGGVDIAGEGRDETVITLLDTSALPWRLLEQAAWEQISGPRAQAEIEQRYADHQADLAVDYTGIGYGIAQNLSCPHRRVTFTGGSAVTGDHDHQRVPRDVLLSNAVAVLERKQLALDPARPAHGPLGEAPRGVCGPARQPTPGALGSERTST